MARIVVIRSPFCLKFRKHWFLTENNFARVFQKKTKKQKNIVIGLKRDEKKNIQHSATVAITITNKKRSLDNRTESSRFLNFKLNKFKFNIILKMCSNVAVCEKKSLFQFFNMIMGQFETVVSQQVD